MRHNRKTSTTKKAIEISDSRVLPAVEARVKAPAVYPQVSHKCEPGYIFVFNDLNGQLITRVSFRLSIVGIGTVKPKLVDMPVRIKYLEVLPIAIRLDPSERIGRLRDFGFSADPGGIAGVEQACGEADKTYSWHFIWMHNSLMFP